MQTRKKSVSLAALGIAIPGTTHSRASHRSPNTATTSQNPSAPQDPPSKRLKRSHTLSSTVSSANPSPASPARRRNTSSASDRHRPHSAAHNNTPPPSPGEHNPAKIDTQGINDDVVVGVLDQLQSTGNRPHLIKELAAVLRNKLRAVQSSSNPVAIISSRLTNYLRRPWTVLAPCPLAKEQVNVHPRRVYFYLTTCPRQPIPEVAEPPSTGMRIISPSVSSGPEEEIETPTENDQRRRSSMSPSPEFDFASSEADFSHSSLNGLSFSESPTFETHHHSFHSHGNHRALSPPLEHDEREFTQTASVMQARKASEQHPEDVHRQQEDSKTDNSAGESSSSSSSTSSPGDTSMSSSIDQFPSLVADVPGDTVSVDPNTPSGIYDDMQDPLAESEETSAWRNHEAAAALFGHNNSHLSLSAAAAVGSSPMLRPSTGKDSMSISTGSGTPARKGEAQSVSDPFAAWGDLKSPEAVELSELDDLMGEF